MKRYLASGILLLCILGCKRNAVLKGEVKTNDLSVQVMQVGETDDTRSNNIFKIRLIYPNRKIGEEQHNMLWYRSDSSFYLLTPHKRVNAAFIQPVANGVSGTYEYLAEFAEEKNNEAPLTIIYQDRLINHKQYQIKLEY